jgi:hypothetical protein
VEAVVVAVVEGRKSRRDMIYPDGPIWQ